MTTQKERPISPHISIYTFGPTMIFSTLHRLSGIFLALGLPILVFFLWSIAEGPSTYDNFTYYSSHWIGQCFLFFFTWAFYYHLCNGIKYLFGDVGIGFSMKSVLRSGKLCALLSIVLTIFTFFIRN
jgi:succinate dehydrogenase / fumarate reductase cytochrome b subunit